MTRDDLPSRALQMGDLLRRGLEDISGKYSMVREVRGMGLLLGMEFDTDAGPLMTSLLERRFMATVVVQNTLRFTPALIVSADEIQGMLDALEESIIACGGSHK
jgi:acetylornithine/N-succinyldiaminopimelate aminotransferase